MKLLLRAVDAIKRVYQYEKTVKVDTKALQSVMIIFITVMLLININNIKLGEYIIVALTYVVAIISIIATIALSHYKDVYKVCRVVVVIFLILAVPISITGSNDGFTLLWYFLLPFITLVLLGMSFGLPVCIGFGMYVTAMFWTPLNIFLKYGHTNEYLFFYPIFYWLFFLLVFAMDIFYKLYQINQIDNEKNLEIEVNEAVSGNKKLMIDAVTTITKMLDEKDAYTQKHSNRVAKYSKLMAQKMGADRFSQEDIDNLYRTALLHDIGKIAIPDAILNKPAKLTNEEYDVMKKHTIWGGEILSGMEFLPQADMGALYHHERYDGKGYPYGIKSEDLPLMIRVISAADALDAMSSNRCYRKQCDRDYIIEEFRKGSGKQFDAEVANIVIDLIKEGEIVV